MLCASSLSRCNSAKARSHWVYSAKSDSIKGRSLLTPSKGLGGNGFATPVLLGTQPVVGLTAGLLAGLADAAWMVLAAMAAKQGGHTEDKDRLKLELESMY